MTTSRSQNFSNPFDNCFSTILVVWRVIALSKTSFGAAFFARNIRLDARKGGRLTRRYKCDEIFCHPGLTDIREDQPFWVNFATFVSFISDILAKSSVVRIVLRELRTHSSFTESWWQRDIMAIEYARVVVYLHLNIPLLRRAGAIEIFFN